MYTVFHLRGGEEGVTLMRVKGGERKEKGERGEMGLKIK